MSPTTWGSKCNLCLSVCLFYLSALPCSAKFTTLFGRLDLRSGCDVIHTWGSECNPCLSLLVSLSVSFYLSALPCSAKITTPIGRLDLWLGCDATHTWGSEWVEEVKRMVRSPVVSEQRARAELTRAFTFVVQYSVRRWHTCALFNIIVYNKTLYCNHNKWFSTVIILKNLTFLV